MSEQIMGNDKHISKWETAERISKTLSMLAIPVVLGVGGWLIQQRLQDQAVSRDYVQMAVSILNDRKGETDPAMRSWAVELLNANSRTKFNNEVKKQLIDGTVKLPEAVNVTQPVPTVVDSSSDREDAADLELKGFEALIRKDAEAALQAFTSAEKLRPKYNNLYEIKTLLEKNRAALNAAPRDGKSQAWSSVYKIITTEYSWRMPPDVKTRLTALI